MTLSGNTGITASFFKVFSASASEGEVKIGLALRTIFPNCSQLRFSSWPVAALYHSNDPMFPIAG